MTGFRTRRDFLRWACALSVTTACSGCGTLLYPERRGQPSGPLDWKVVALNGIGLLFFFVPGVIAFAVDFINGTIYLPPEQHYGTAGNGEPARLAAVSVPAEKLNRETIAEHVTRHAGVPVQLEPGSYAVQELETIDAFWETHDAYSQ
jgi:hypothetical protein